MPNKMKELRGMSDEQLKLTENTQPAILTMSTAVARVLQEKGIVAQFAAGHSLGEYSAHVTAGTLDFADAVRTVRNRGRYMQEAVPAGEGGMAAIMGMTRALDTLKEVAATGVPADRPDLAVSIEEIMRLMDYDEMRELERRLLTTETLETKYGTG